MRAIVGHKQTADSVAQYLKSGGQLGGMIAGYGLDAAIGNGMAFIVGELEKRDPKLYEPLTSTTWPRDIVAKTGGGWVEFTSNYFADYAGAGTAEQGVIGGQSNEIPIMQADISKDVWKVVTWANILKIPYVDQAKLQGIGRSLENILDKGIKLNYNKTLDKLVYTGFTSLKFYGILNDPNIYASAVAAGVSGKTEWKFKTPDETLADINNLLVACWARAEYDLSGMPNHILIPPTQYAWLVSQKVSSAGNCSILQYLLDNNIAKNQGVDLQIYPSRWCVGAGTAGTDRMFAYVNDEDKVNFDLPVPLGRVMTMPDVTHMSYMTAFAAQIGQVKFMYYQCCQYADGI